jgi:N-acetylmuramoyl-L-alanine amidase
LSYTNLKAHDHNLNVTQNTNIPAVLLELGFISNSDEVKRLSDGTEQYNKAQKIAQIVGDYFSTNLI